MNKLPRILFVLSLFVLLSFWQTGVYLNDEIKSANQLTNLVHGSLHIREQKIDLNPRYYYTLGNVMIAPYTHFLPVFALPAAAVLFLINTVFGLRLFFSIVWSACWYILCLLAGGELNRKELGHRIGLLSIPLFAVNAAISIMNPIDFGAWWEIMSIQFLNIIATVASIQIIYHLFKRLFNSSAIGFFAGAFVLFASSITFWGVSAKDHASVIFLASAAFYAFYLYSQNSNALYRYAAYFCAALNVWVRLDSAVPLIISLMFVDTFFITKTKRLSNFIKVSVVILISLAPYFINNYLIYGNPLFPPQYTAQFGVVEPSTAADGTNPVLAIKSNISQSSHNLIPFISAWKAVFESSSFIGLTFAVFFYFNEGLSTVTAAIFEFSPFLVLSVAGIIAIGFIRFKNKQASAIEILFLSYSVVLTLVYFKFIGNSAQYILPSYDMRYFITLQITLLYFALKPTEHLLKSNTRGLLEYSAGIALVLGIAVVVLNNSVHWAGYPMDILLIMKYLGTSGIVFMLLSYTLYCKLKSWWTPKLMTAAIAYSLSIGFLWVLLTVTRVKTAGDLEGARTMVVPFADFLKDVLNYYIQFYRYV